MFKIIFVDDDRFTVSNLKSSVDWGKWGFEVVGAFFNAESAIEFMKTNNVDAIISDIKMPGMNGVEFAEYISENHPKTVFTILSGYEDFKYAQSAIRYNVVDYILKPTAMADIERAIINIKKNLESRARNVTQYDSSYIEMQEFIANYIKKRTNDLSPLKKALIKRGMCVDISQMPVAFVNVTLFGLRKFLTENWNYGREALNFAIENMLNREDNFVILIKHSFDMMEYIILFDCVSIEECRKKLSELILFVTENVKTLFGLEIRISEKKIEKNIMNIFDDVYDEFVNINVDTIYKLMTDGDAEKAVAQFDYFTNKIKRDRLYLSKFSELLTETARQGKNFNYYSFETQRLLDMGVSCGEADLNESIENLIKRISEENRRVSQYDYVGMAKKYVNDHYSEHITLSDVAKFVSVSENYFGKLFRRKTNKTFIDYLNEVRIEKAIYLLENTNHTVDNVSIMVGYNSRPHFFKIFKRIKGCSPSEYRKTLSNGSET